MSSPLERLLGILALLLCIQTTTQASSSPRIISKTYPLPSWTPGLSVDTDKTFSSEDGFSYLMCQSPAPRMPAICNVTTETWPFPGGAYRSVCRGIALANNDNRNTDLGGAAKFWLLRPDRAVIYSHSRVHGRAEFEGTLVALFLVVDMSNCSVVRELTFPTNSSEGFVSQMIPYQDSFEIIDYNRGRLTYDLDGRQIGDPKPYKDISFVILPVSRHSSDRGYYSMRRSSQSIEEEQKEIRMSVAYVDVSGQPKELESNMAMIGGLPDSYSISNAHELLGICWLHPVDNNIYTTIPTEQVRCSQFDTQGMRMNLTLKLPYNTTWVAVHNLDNGQLLVATGHCEETTLEVHCKGFRIQRITANGQQLYRSLDLEGFEIRYSVFSAISPLPITENSGRELCFSWNWQYEKKDGNELKYKKWCVATKYTLMPQY